jgi:hypothetical protein
MADSNKPQAKNELGQLFVDIGIGGLGKTLKGLNSVAATFLLGKNAAMQFAKTMTEPFKQAGNAAVGIGKMSNALATSSTEYQKLAMYLKKYNLSEELLGDINKLETTFYDLSQGFTNLQGSLAVGLQQAGLNAQDYKGTFEDTMKLIDDLQRKTANMSKEKRNQILRQIEISTDWGYLWDKGGRAGDYLTISDEALRKNQNLIEAMTGLKNTMDNLWQETLSKMAPALTTIATRLDEWATNWGQNGGVDKTANAVKGAHQSLNSVNPVVRSLFPIVPVVQGVKGAVKGYTGGAASISSDILNNASLPGNLSSSTQSITNNISHDITINGDNAQDIANQIAGITAQDIQYTQYQASNLAGI